MRTKQPSGLGPWELHLPLWHLLPSAAFVIVNKNAMFVLVHFCAAGNRPLPGKEKPVRRVSQRERAQEKKQGRKEGKSDEREIRGGETLSILNPELNMTIGCKLLAWMKEITVPKEIR